MATDEERATRTAGLLYAVGAYVLWGAFPVYWKQLAAVPALSLLGHRVVWSFAFLFVFLTLRRRWDEVLRVFRDPGARRAMLLSTVLISTNWGVFIWAVNSGYVLSASLGYYMNPLLNVVLARMFLGERLRLAQGVAVGLALVGVVNLAVGLGRLPWPSVVLALTFATYGLVRKKAPVASIPGLAVETGLITPLALGYLLLVPQAVAVTSLTGLQQALLVGSGLATAIPLLWFAEGAKRLRYTTLGIVQYIAPTGQFLVAVLLYDEAFTTTHAVTFGCIWAAVVLYAADGWRASRQGS